MPVALPICSLLSVPVAITVNGRKRNKKPKPEHNQIPPINLPYKTPYKDNRNDRADAAWTHREPALQRRITKQRLQEQRQERSGAVKRDAHCGNQRCAGCKVTIGKHAQIYNRIFCTQLPDNERNKRNDRDQEGSRAEREGY